MLWLAALLSLIIWGIGRESGFLGPRVHIFLLLAILAILAAFMPSPSSHEVSPEDGTGAGPDAAVPGLPNVSAGSATHADAPADPYEGHTEHRTDHKPP